MPTDHPSLLHHRAAVSRGGVKFTLLPWVLFAAAVVALVTVVVSSRQSLTPNLLPGSPVINQPSGGNVLPPSNVVSDPAAPTDQDFRRMMDDVEGGIEVGNIAKLGEPTATILLTRFLEMIESEPLPSDHDTSLTRAFVHCSVFGKLSELATARGEHILAQQHAQAKYDFLQNHPDKGWVNSNVAANAGMMLISTTLVNRDKATARRIAEEIFSMKQVQSIGEPKVESNSMVVAEALKAFEFDLQPEMAAAVVAAYDGGWLAELGEIARPGDKLAIKSVVLRASLSLKRFDVAEGIYAERWKAHQQTPTVRGLHDAAELAELVRVSRPDESGAILLAALQSVDRVREQLQKPNENIFKESTFSENIFNENIFPQADERDVRNAEITICSHLQSAGNSRPDLALVGVERFLDRNLVTDKSGRDNLLMQRADLLKRLETFVPPAAK